MKTLIHKSDKRTKEEILADDTDYQEFPDENYYLKSGETEKQRQERLIKLGYKEIEIT